MLYSFFKIGIQKLEAVFKREFQDLFRYRVTPHIITGLLPADLLVGRRLHTHLSLIHPDTSCKVIKKQDKLTGITKPVWKLLVGDCLYARNFKGNDKWIPDTVTCITVPVSYQVQTSSSTIQCHHVDQLHYLYPLNSDNQEPNDIDDWPFSNTTSTTDAPSNLEQGHGQWEVTSSITFSLQHSIWKVVEGYGPYF